MDEVIWQENNLCDLLQHYDNILILVSEVINMLIFTMTNDAINHKSIMTQGKYIYAFMKKAVDFHRVMATTHKGKYNGNTRFIEN